LDGDRHEIVARDERRTPRDSADRSWRVRESARSSRREAGIPLHEFSPSVAPLPVRWTTGPVWCTKLRTSSASRSSRRAALSDALDGLTSSWTRHRDAAIAEHAIGAARALATSSS